MTTPTNENSFDNPKWMAEGFAHIEGMAAALDIKHNLTVESFTEFLREFEREVGETLIASVNSFGGNNNGQHFLLMTIAAIYLGKMGRDLEEINQKELLDICVNRVKGGK